MSESATEPVRVDKWLWAARFFKTRALATEAIQGGKVHLNGARVKPARGLRPGDTLEIHKGTECFVVVVEGVAERRGSASVAQALYRETEDSQQARAALREQQRLLAAGLHQPAQRPDKKQRRQLRRLKDY